MAEIVHRELSFAVMGAAMEVHRCLGPGYLEVIYERALAHEMGRRSIPFQEQAALPVYYKDRLVGEYYADFIVDGKIILELKAASTLTAVPAAQVHHYLAATGLRLGILLNFGEVSLHFKRIVR